MKKKRILFCILFLFLITAIFILLAKKNTQTFYLEKNDYGTNKITEIENQELNQLIDTKKSFAVFVYQPMCVTSSDFENILYDFLAEKKISIYKISFSNLKDTNIGKKIKYYPSFILYNKGKMVDFLEADQEEDVEYYTSKEAFENWFTKYVKLKDFSSVEIKSTQEQENEDNDILQDITLEEVIREKKKVNIYFFWGNGCPHCEEEFKFFESIKEKYKDYYNLYTFETWYNETNLKLLKTFAENMEDVVTGVPYTIIGNKSFIGFHNQSKSDFIHAIENQYQNSYDVYFDKIKKPA